MPNPVRQYSLKSEPRSTPVAFVQQLNPEQRRVVTAGGGPMLVLAGAGSGKTRTLTYRAAWLVQQGVPADRILLLTFTNKAAKEMIERVTTLVPEVGQRLWSGTFHSICHRILRTHAERLGYGTNYVVLDGQEVRDLMDLSVTQTLSDPTIRRFPKADLLAAMLSSSVNTNRSLEQVLAEDFPKFLSQAENVEKVLTAFLANKVAMNAMDYDDLLVNVRLLFIDHPDIHALYAERFRYVLVDEYQDTNPLQAALVQLFGAHHGNIMVVGDDCQAIYGFRGSDVANILRFSEQLPGTEVHRLETNYRSTPQILEIANASITHNRAQFPKVLKAVAEDGPKPAFLPAYDEQQQAEFVAQRVLELRDEGVELSKQAVLYRAHYQALALQLELQRRGIPFVIRSGMRFFEQAHIRDVLAHLRLLFNPLDRLAWIRVLKLQEGIGNRHAQTIFEGLTAGGDPWQALQVDLPGQRLPGRAQKGWAALRGLLMRLAQPSLTSNPGAMLDAILSSGYAERLEAGERAAERIEDIQQLAHHAAAFSDYASFLEDLALVEQVAAEDVKSGGEDDEKLVLSTVHQAKGLEWEAVFLIQLADGQLPLRRCLRSEEDEAEERRLFYVAVTRARRQLYLCFPQWGADREKRRVLQRPSRFLAELPHTDPRFCETWRLVE